MSHATCTVITLNKRASERGHARVRRKKKRSVCMQNRERIGTIADSNRLINLYAGADVKMVLVRCQK